MPSSPVDAAHRERRVGRGRAADRVVVRPGVTGRHHEQRAALCRQPVDRLAERVVAVCVRVAQAHVDDVGALVDGPLHPGQDPRLAADALGDTRTGEAELHDLSVDQLRALGDARVQAVRCGAAAGDDRRHVRAVTDVVVGVLLLGEVLSRADMPGQVRMRGIDAAVEHGYRDAGAGEAALPRGRRADLLDVGVGVGVHLGVEPQLRGAGGQRRGRLGSAAAHHVPPEPRRVRLRHVGRDTLHTGQAARHPRARRVGALRQAGGAVLDDDRHRRARRVVVALLDQSRDVEQLLVHSSARYQRHGLVGDDVQRLAGREDRIRRGSRGAVEHRRARVGAGHDLNPIAGHERDLVTGVPGICRVRSTRRARRLVGPGGHAGRQGGNHGGHGDERSVAAADRAGSSATSARHKSPELGVSGASKLGIVP